MGESRAQRNEPGPKQICVCRRVTKNPRSLMAEQSTSKKGM